MGAQPFKSSLTARNPAFQLVPLLGLALLACVTPGAAVALDDPTLAPHQSEGSEASSDVTPPPSRELASDATRATRLQALALSMEECLSVLEEAGVAVEPLDPEQNAGVEMPVRLNGPIDGVAVALRGHDQTHAVLDCRLAVALLSWAPTLRKQGITRLEHYSIYRPGARTGRKRKPSGHSRGLAIDAARFHFSDGHMLDVLDDWGAHERGADPCLGDIDSSTEDRTLRELICDAVARELFTVVLTPHHDKAHDNHVHMELVPGVDWTYVR